MNKNEKWNIRTCKIYSSEFEYFEPNPPGRLIQEFRFNKHGFVNELIRYGIQGDTIAHFDIAGAESPFPFPEDPQFIDTVLTLEAFDSLNVLIRKEIKRFNKLGLLTSDEIYGPKDSLVSRNTYKYNKMGLIEEDVYWDVELQKPAQVVRYQYEFYEK